MIKSISCAADEEIRAGPYNAVAPLVTDESVACASIVNVVVQPVALAELTYFCKRELVDEFALVDEFVTKGEEVHP